MPKTKGYRRGTRKLLTKNAGTRSLPSPDIHLYDYSVGDRVLILLEPSSHGGMPHRRYHGKIGTIVERRGRAYVVGVAIGGKTKKIIARKEHLKPA